MSEIIRIGFKQEGKKYHMLGILDETIMMDRYIKKTSEAIKKEVVRLENMYPQAAIVTGYEYVLGYKLCKELFCEGIKTVIFTKEYDDLEILTNAILKTDHEIYIPKDQIEGALGLFQVADLCLESVNSSKKELKRLLVNQGFYDPSIDLLENAHMHEDVEMINTELEWLEDHLTQLDRINHTLLEHNI